MICDKFNLHMSDVGASGDRAGFSQQPTRMQLQETHGHCRCIENREAGRVATPATSSDAPKIVPHPSPRTSPTISKKTLHKMPYEHFQDAIASLREVTKDAVQLSCQEQERLFLDGEYLETRIACLKKRIHLARGELRSKGEIGKKMEDKFQLSLAKQGDDGKSSAEPALLCESRCDSVTEKEPTIKITSNIHGDLVAKNIPERSSTCSSVHGTHTTEGSNGSMDNEIPQMSWGSLTSMLGASKAWLDQPSGETRRDSIANIRLSFADGADDGMPSRWKAREKEREKSAKETKEADDEVERLRQKSNKIGGAEISTSLIMKGKSIADRLADLIFKREGEISSLEARTLSVDQQASSLRNEISGLQRVQRQTQDRFEQEKMSLIDELDRVTLHNEKLDEILVETGVSLEVKKISVELLAVELKEARGELALTQNERDRKNAEQRRKEKARRWRWMSSSNDNKPEQREKKQQQQQKQTKQQQLAQGQHSKAQAQCPSNTLQQYQTIVSTGDGGTSDGHIDTTGSGSYQHCRDRSHSLNSNGTGVSSLTLNSDELVDILQEIDFDL